MAALRILCVAGEHLVCDGHTGCWRVGAVARRAFRLPPHVTRQHPCSDHRAHLTSATPSQRPLYRAMAPAASRTLHLLLLPGLVHYCAHPRFLVAPSRAGPWRRRQACSSCWSSSTCWNSRQTSRRASTTSRESSICLPQRGTRSLQVCILIVHSKPRPVPDCAPAEPQTAAFTLAKLQDPVKRGLEQTQKDIKPVYSGLNKYGKALDKVRRSRLLHHRTDTDASRRSSKINPSRPPPTTPYPRTRS